MIGFTGVDFTFILKNYIFSSTKSQSFPIFRQRIRENEKNDEHFEPH